MEPTYTKSSKDNLWRWRVETAQAVTAEEAGKDIEAHGTVALCPVQGFDSYDAARKNWHWFKEQMQK